MSTGDGRGGTFRLLGGAGCVRPATTVNGDDSRSADKLEQASSAVPKKTMRNGDMRGRQTQIYGELKKKLTSFSARGGVARKEDGLEPRALRRAPDRIQSVLPTNSRNPNKDIHAIRRR